jgi:putative RNA 2'-phosphotransferase
MVVYFWQQVLFFYFGFGDVNRCQAKVEERLMKKDEVIRLSKLMSFALRHNPQAFNLTLDDEGWIDLTLFVKALTAEKKWSIDEASVRFVVETSDKQRFEIEGNRIRARYGHSKAARPTYEPVTPPPILYHGTPRRNLPKIRTTGLKAMSRQYVHLSTTTDMALMVGHRRDEKPALLKIRALEAHQAGIEFGTPSGNNDNVYLVATMPSEFIDFPD